MSHLDDLVAALVDNELSHDQRDRALAHITRCAPCRAEVDAQRRLKALLANQSDPEVSPSLTARLLVVATVASGPTHPDVVRRRPARRRAEIRRGRVATYSVVGVALMAGVVAAGGQHDGRPVRPPVTAFVDEHNATTDRLGPVSDPALVVTVASLTK